MSTFQISGIIQKIGDTESIPYRDRFFKKREVVLDCSYRNQFTGQIERPNYPKFEFTGNHVEDLVGFQIGDIVTLSFSLNGSRFEKDGNVRYFTNIQGFKIEKYQTPYNNRKQGEKQSAQAFNGSQSASSSQTALLNTPSVVDEQHTPIDRENNDDLPF